MYSGGFWEHFVWGLCSFSLQRGHSLWNMESKRKKKKTTPAEWAIIWLAEQMEILIKKSPFATVNNSFNKRRKTSPSRGNQSLARGSWLRHQPDTDWGEWDVLPLSPLSKEVNDCAQISFFFLCQTQPTPVQSWAAQGCKFLMAVCALNALQFLFLKKKKKKRNTPSCEYKYCTCVVISKKAQRDCRRECAWAD